MNIHRRALAVALAGLTLTATANLAEAQTLEPMRELELRYHAWFVVDDSAKSTRSRTMTNRPETRVRVGVKQSPNTNHIEGELTVITGDPREHVSGWEALGAVDGAQRISLDRAWIGVGFDPLPDLRFILGRSEAPWSTTGMLWDPDLVLPGLWVDWRSNSDNPRAATYHVNAGVAYLISDGPELDDESLLRGVSAEASIPMGEETVLEVGLGYFDMSGERELGQAIAREEAVVATRPAGFTANTTATDDTPRIAGMGGAEAELTQRLVLDGLASDFNILSANASLRLGLLEHMPLRLRGHVSWNLGAAGPGDDQALGLLGGVGLGELTRPGRGRVQVNYLRIAADAALDLFNREHYGTNIEGVEVTGDLIILEGWIVGFAALYSWQVEPDLRGYGDGRGEPFPGDPTSTRLFATTGYTF